jgi:hypothetical protein
MCSMRLELEAETAHVPCPRRQTCLADAGAGGDRTTLLRRRVSACLTVSGNEKAGVGGGVFHAPL